MPICGIFSWARNLVNFGLIELIDKSSDYAANFPLQEVIAQRIMENLESAPIKIS